MIEGVLTGSPSCLPFAAARAPELLEPILKITTREVLNKKRRFALLAEHPTRSPQSYFCADPCGPRCPECRTFERVLPGSLKTMLPLLA
ncbi:hypothetical protein CONPUDRAFT_138051 [Coniophora puteana RWD-64-598 SS2]|uniref:Uncharacterized protein n=1 Tax=Coniophora puteana (strain RWD-64-598) TaxID=741705 RepID=A0A5M3MLG9_CONPW|nr:uncharacterized protein CONPUDRAFT_138051 [Coniophora puteana RWD-64-598 SS2]EIW79877.1 hypothetical protein CONPUDRAFT_138051 [Coniophora puteana RWD-64-598 SS2]